MNRNIIVIGASAGGVEAIPRLLSSLPARIKASFFVTLHVSPHNESMLPQLISRSGVLAAEHPRDGAAIKPGRVYVAPPDHHLLIQDGVVRLGRGPKENRHRPAIDPLFRSAAAVYGERVAGVLLTGNLDDGVSGLRDIQQHGGLAIVQDPIEAPYPDMPRNALHAFRPDHCLPLKQIEDLLKRLPNSNSEASMKGKKHGKNSQGSGEKVATPPKPGPPVPLVCPECQGPLWEFRDGELVRFQCLVGHRYSLESFLAAQADELEAAMWIALRTLEERIALQRRLLNQRPRSDADLTGKMFLERIEENERHATVLRQTLERIAR